MKYRNKRGMALFIVFVTLIIIALIVFSLHKYARHQLIKGHKEELVSLADHVAQCGINFALTALHDERSFRPKFFADEAVQKLLKSDFPVEKISLNSNRGFCREVANLYQNICVDSVDIVSGITCESIELEISNAAFLGPDGNLGSLSHGRDYHEKKGTIKISCTISIGDLISRKATMTRDFKLFSYIPGPYARFNFFVRSSSQRANYTGANPYFNVVKSDINGNYLNNDYRRLILINAPDTSTTKSLNSTELLKNSGWVYLGRRSTEGTVLNMPAGFNPGITKTSEDPFSKYPAAIQSGLGAGSYLARPNTSGGDASSYLLQNVSLRNGLQPISKTFGLFWGANSYGPWGEPMEPVNPANPQKSKVLSPQKCLTSWLLPFGTQHYPSPTLMVGNIVAGYLSTIVISKPGQSFDTRIYFNTHEIDKYNRNTNFPVMTRAFAGDMAKGNNDLVNFVSQTSLTNFNNSLPIVHKSLLTMGNIIDETNRPGILALMWSFANYPAQSLPYIPINFLFEVLHDKYEMLDFFKLENSNSDNLRKVCDRAALPGNSIWAPPEAQPSHLSYFQTWDPLPIWLYSATPPQLGDSSPGVYFKASLDNCNFDKLGGVTDTFRNALLRRATAIINLPGKKELNLSGITGLKIQEKYQEILTSRKLFVEKNGELNFTSHGIYRIVVGDGSEIENFELLLPVKTWCGGILAIENANVTITAIEPVAPEKNPLGQPEHAFSVICLDGKIKLNSTSDANAAYPVHAYLAALSVNRAGSIEKASGNGLYVDGGVAVAKIDSLFDNYKKDGGIIRYNPLFNPNKNVRSDLRYGFKTFAGNSTGIEFQGTK